MKKNNLKNFKYLTCQICNSKRLNNIFDLGYQPTVNDFPKISDQRVLTETYPLKINFCKRCSLVQLDTKIDTNKIFPLNYAYRSGTTKILIDNFKDLSNDIEKLNILNSGDKILDIGSNDGTLLKSFKKDYLRLGVEPTDIAKISIKNGIKTIQKPFSYALSKKIKKKYGKFKVITAANVFAHIDNVHDVLKGVINLIHDDGIFVNESHYLKSFLDTIQYDTIYHEHLRYYSINSQKYLFKEYNLNIFDAKKIPTHGGSIRIYVSKNKKEFTKNAKKLIKEESSGVKLQKELLNFKKRVLKSKVSFWSLVSKLILKNKKIVGISAPSRASTMINYLGIDENIVSYICEKKGSLKIGKFIPGTKIKVINEDFIIKDQPDFAVIFSWHIYKDLIKILKKKGYKGKFIIPLPKPKIL